MHVHIYFDGATKPRNPGPSVGAALIIDPKSGETLATASDSLDHCSNNVAEYMGLIAGLKSAIDLGATQVTVFGDSQLIIEQTFGTYGCYKEDLQALNAQAKSLAANFGENIKAQHIKRKLNAAADALCERVYEQIFGNETSTPEGREDIGFVINLRLSAQAADDRSKRNALAKALRAVVEGAFPLAAVSVTRITE